MSIQQTIEHKLDEGLRPSHMTVENESHMHSVPPGSESHFKVTVVARAFEGRMPVARHRMINELLAEELAGQIHALSLHTMTPDEWEQKGHTVPDSPACRGGSKATV